MRKIKTQKELDKLISKFGNLDCFVQLNYELRSSKNISFDENNDYFVYNFIDDSEEIITRKKLKDTIIGRALKLGALYQD